MAIEWTKSYEIGIDEVDVQHQELFKRVDKLLGVFEAGKVGSVTAETADFLEDYVVVHFGTEEKFMQESNFPNFDEHKIMHDDFIKTFGELKKRLNEEGPTLSLKIHFNHVCVEWLINHIGKHDREFAKYLKKNN